MTTRKTIYFISDLHLGATYLDNPLDYERRVVEWLRSIEDDAAELYLLGDVLDYWYEYRTVVPRGFTRFLGQLGMMADSGIKITWIIGNHDIWINDYIPNELGITVVDGTITKEILGKRFFLAHGDALGKLPKGFRFIRWMFRNKFLQHLYAAVHPRWTVTFAHRWSSHSRNYSAEIPVFAGPDKEPFVAFAEEYQKEHPDCAIDYFVLGHRHILLDYQLSSGGKLIVLGDWIHHFSYGKWDGENFILQCYDNKMQVK
ncbi:MAG: UDP-2,3-diacylglucosamine diphosphatase [Bacteroidales bacterium]|nr:UDP-2,3-diacylglucosamine diphosphatase [Bacteroidales bacterium]